LYYLAPYLTPLILLPLINWCNRSKYKSNNKNHILQGNIGFKQQKFGVDGHLRHIYFKIFFGSLYLLKVAQVSTSNLKIRGST
jgi:hypothetical protein